MPNKILRIIRNTFQKVTRSDLTRIPKHAQQTVFDVILQHLLQVGGAQLPNLTSAYLPSAARVTYVSGDRSVGAVLKVSAGWGFKRDDSEADADSPRCKPIHIAVDTNLATLAASDPTNARIDRVYARPLLVAENPQTVDIIDPGTEVVTATPSVNQDERFGVETVIATGTPAASPSLPSNPVGWTDADEIARVTVQPGSGGVSAGDILDRRVLYELPSDLMADVAADMVSVASPLLDAHVQAALERIDAKPNPANHASTHTGFGADRLAFLVRNIVVASGALSQGQNLIQTLDFSGRGGNSRVLVLCYMQMTGAANATVQAFVQGAAAGNLGQVSIIYDGGNPGAAGALSIAYTQSVAALSGRTFSLNLNVIQDFLNGAFNGVIVVVDFGRV